MADEEAAAEESGSQAEHGEGTAGLPTVDIEYVDSLPGGRKAMLLEGEGRSAWVFVRGHVSPEAGSDMLADMRHAVSSGLWRQNWQPRHPS
ncbi:hypothetical protein [Streptomyces sp. NPDC047070]|uniref:hypothetical protein n=1 Tax=Streptomyces sp. NPDC047070 TaxID=3154923 RepID=UPI0034572F71